MPKAVIGVGGPDLAGGADLAVVGNAAQGSRRDIDRGPQELTGFSVKRGDNGGVIVCETYEKKAPKGRRVGAAFLGGGDYRENPFSPGDGAAVTSHVTGLLGEMGVSAPEPMAPEPEPEGPPAPQMAAMPAGGEMEDEGYY